MTAASEGAHGMRKQEDFDRQFAAIIGADPELRDAARESRRVARNNNWASGGSAGWWALPLMVPLLALGLVALAGLCVAALAGMAWDGARGLAARRRERGKS
jgi:hypothetical protein